MKQLLMLFAVSAMSFSSSAAEAPKKCGSAIYAIFHQSCVLSLEMQQELLKAEQCTTVDEDKYFFYFADKVVEYSVPNCKLTVH